MAKKYVNFSLKFPLILLSDFVDLSPSFSITVQKDEGTAYDYACGVLSLGLFFLDFKDAVREGDGDRIFKHWKYLLLLFKASGRSNYTIEALTLLTQYHIVLPPNLLRGNNICYYFVYIYDNHNCIVITLNCI